MPGSWKLEGSVSFLLGQMACAWLRGEHRAVDRFLDCVSMVAQCQQRELSQISASSLSSMQLVEAQGKELASECRLPCSVGLSTL